MVRVRGFRRNRIAWLCLFTEFLPSFSFFLLGSPPPPPHPSMSDITGFFFTEFLKEEGGGVRSTHPSIDALHFSYRFYFRTTSSSVGIFASKKSFCFCFIFFFCDRLSSSFIGRHQVVCGGPLASVCYRVFFFSLSLSLSRLPAKLRRKSASSFFFWAFIGFRLSRPRNNNNNNNNNTNNDDDDCNSNNHRIDEKTNENHRIRNGPTSSTSPFYFHPKATPSATATTPTTTTTTTTRTTTATTATAAETEANLRPPIFVCFYFDRLFFICLLLFTGFSINLT